MTHIVDWDDDRVELEIEGVPVIMYGHLTEIEVDGELFTRESQGDFDPWIEVQKGNL
jgi:hypothetical protein